MPDFDLTGELSLKIELHMLRPITEKVHSGNGPVSLVPTPSVNNQPDWSHTEESRQICEEQLPTNWERNSYALGPTVGLTLIQKGSSYQNHDSSDHRQTQKLPSCKIKAAHITFHQGHL